MLEYYKKNTFITLYSEDLAGLIICNYFPNLRLSSYLYARIIPKINEITYLLGAGEGVKLLEHQLIKW